MFDADDLAKMAVPELEKLIDEALVALKQARIRNKKDALKEVQDIASSYGLSVEDLIAEGKKKPTEKRPEKYRSPADPSITWSGFGRKPKWFMEALDAGHSEESMLIG